MIMQNVCLCMHDDVIMIPQPATHVDGDVFHREIFPRCLFFREDKIVFHRVKMTFCCDS